MKQPESETTRVHQTRCIYLTDEKGAHCGGQQRNPPEEAERKLVRLETSSPADTCDECEQGSHRICVKPTCSHLYV